MRPLALVLALFVTPLAAAQEPLAPAVEQAPLPPPTVMTPRNPMVLTPPQGWHYQIVDGPPTHVRSNGLIAGGAVMLSVAYAANLQAGIPTGQWMLDIPLFGPLMEIVNIPGGDSLVGWVDFMLVTDSLVQLGGLAMLIAGGTTWKNKPGLQRLELVPTGAGAAIRGSF